MHRQPDKQVSGKSLTLARKTSTQHNNKSTYASMKNTFPQMRALAVLAANLLAIHLASGQAITWSGGGGANTAWALGANWAGTVPGLANDVSFLDGAAASTVSNINNVVDASLSIRSLRYANSNGFHTTLIAPGQTLTIPNNISVGTGTSNGADFQIVATITGPGGTLAMAGGQLIVRQPEIANNTLHRATLDLSGLGTFNANMTYLSVAYQASGAARAPAGTVILARTNLITVTGQTAPAIDIASGPDVGGKGDVLLGQTNVILTDSLSVSREKSTASLRFNPSFTNGNPVAFFRGYSTARQSSWRVGDNNDQTSAATVGTTGTTDFTGGTLDALVGTAYIGRGKSGSGTSGLARGTGTLTIGAGTFDVNTVQLGRQPAANASSATGTINVNGPGALVVNTVLEMGHATDGASGAKPVATLNLNGGDFKVGGNIVDGGGTTTINLNGGLLDMNPSGKATGGTITVKTLKVSGGAVTNYSLLGATTLNLLDPATTFIVYPGQVLAPASTNAGTLTVNGSLTVTNVTLRYDLVDPSTANDTIVVTNLLTLSGANVVDITPVNGTIPAGDYTLMTYGTLSGDASNLQVLPAWAHSRYTFAFDTSVSPNVVLHVGGSPPVSLTWSGDGAANAWDLSSAVTWNSNTEKFYDLDTVTFDDSGSTSPAVNLAGTLMPTGVTVNSGNNYTFSGSGTISGVCGLANLGSGTLTVLNTNDYTGATAISGGTVQVNGGLGKTAVTVGSGAALGGSGAILGAVTVQSGATFSPGAPIGTLTISNNLVLAAGSTSVFDANMDTLAQDAVVGLTKVTYGGTLSLALSGRPLVGSDMFKLFSAKTYAGTFSSIIPDAPGAGLLWNTNTLATDGTLRIVDPLHSALTVQANNNQVELDWPPENLTWRLQAQTNAPGAGLGTNWVIVPGSGSTNRVIMAVDPANGSVFYRLVYP
jgi:autotransporter-associated beta strand protein